MFVSPVIERELRIVLRNQAPIKGRLSVAALAAAAVMVFLLLSYVERQWAQFLHFILFFGAMVLAVVRPLQITAGMISEERRNQTLELLFLTGISPGELFVGKLLGAVVAASSELLALVPFFALPFVSGGLSLDLYVATIVCVPVIFLFVVAVSLMTSALFVDDTASFLSTLAVIAVICAAAPVPFFAGKFLTGAAPFSSAWLVSSPAYAVLMIGQRFSIGSLTDFWCAMLCTVAWSTLCFFIASAWLARHWRARTPDGLGEWCRRRWGALVRGTISWRQNLRRTVLERNAFEWLVRRDRRPIVFAWLAMGTLGVVWLAGLIVWRRHWLSLPNFFLTATVFLMLLDAIVALTAARQMAQDRRDGILELLLTTKLSPMEMVEGQKAAIRQEFEPLRFAVLGMMLVGFALRSWNFQALLTYVAIWSVFIMWSTNTGSQKVPMVMWVAANTGRTTFSAMGRNMQWWVWIWLAAQARNIVKVGGYFPEFPHGTTGECVIVVFIAFIILFEMAVVRQQTSDMQIEFSRQLRSIAQDPVPEKGDPRYKKWKNLQERFPSA